MNLYNRYLLILAALFFSSATILAILNKRQWDLYLSVFIMEFLVVTLAFTHLPPSARHVLNIIGRILLIGFVAIVLLRVGPVLLEIGDGF